jgi:hypothetical protein
MWHWAYARPVMGRQRQDIRFFRLLLNFISATYIVIAE